MSRAAAVPEADAMPQALAAETIDPELSDTSQRSFDDLAGMPRYFPVNTACFPFRDAFERMLSCAPLTTIHQVASSEMEKKRSEDVRKGAAQYVEGSKEYKRYIMRESLRMCLLNKRGEGNTPTFVRQRVLSSEHYGDFMTMYREFVNSVVLPLFDEPSGEFAIQKEPCIRVHVPGETVLGRRENETGEHVGMHRDTDYGHQNGEVTFVVALTPMYGSNSVWAESVSDAGDFAPFTMDYGHFRCWNSAHCRHFNKVNETGTARMSFDFRVIPMSQYDDSNAKCDRDSRFKLGEYFTLSKT